jgi:rod shape determining protein RodA
MMSSAGLGSRSESSARLWPIDWGLVLAAAILLTIGVISLSSIDVGAGTGFAKKQIFNAVIGLVVFGFCSRLSHDRLRAASVWCYIGNIAILAAVLMVGESRGIAQRWLEIGPIKFQPSEVSKILVAITLANFFTSRRNQIKEAWTFIASLLHIAPVMALLILQPHVGATISVFAIWIACAVYAGIPWKSLAVAFSALVALLTGLYFAPIPQFDYARSRITGMVRPDPQNEGYQVYQGTIALALGGPGGSGYAQGEWTQAGRVPEQQNDFVFSVVGEEGGLFGAGILFLAFLFFFFRIWSVGSNSQSYFGRVMVGGLFGILAFHTIVNLGMNLGLSPVVGLWLPFISAGGSALWMCLASVGLISSARFFEHG